MAEMTRAEFIKKYGKAPEDFEVNNRPDPVQPAMQRRYKPFSALQDQRGVLPGEEDPTAAIPVVRPTKDDEVVRNNEKPYVPSEGLTSAAQRQTEMLKRVISQEQNPEIRDSMLKQIDAETPDRLSDAAIPEQLVKNVGSGVMQIPAAIPATVDLVRFGVPAVVHTLMNNDPKIPAYKQIANDFMNSVFDEESKQELQDHLVSKVDEFKKAKPDATPAQIMAFTDQYQDSQEFFDTLTAKLPTGLRWAQQANDWANKTMGLGKRPDEQTVVDDMEQVFGQSIVGLPSAVTKSIKAAITKTVGKRIASSTAASIAARTAEAITPLSLPYTPANVGVNAGVGMGMTEATRALSNQPSLINGGNPQNVAATATAENPDELKPLLDIEPPDGHGVDVGGQIDSSVVAGGVTIGGLLSLPAIRKQVVDNAIKGAESEALATIRSATDVNPVTMMKAGPTLREQADIMEPTLSPITGLADANSPAKHVAQKLKPVDDTETVPRIDAALSSASTVNRIEAENKAANFGILDGVDDTIPLVELKRVASSMDDETYQLFNDYSYAVGRSQDYQARTKSLEASYAEQKLSVEAALARGDTRAVGARQTKLSEIEAKLTALKNDDPDARSSFRDVSMEQVNQFIKAGEANPQVKQLADMTKKIGNDLLKYMEVNGLIDKAEALQQASKRPYYVPLRERAYPDVDNPIKRQALLFKDKVFGKGDGEEGFYASQIRRELSGEGAVVNRPKDVLSAIQEAVFDAVRQVTANNARKEVIDLLDALPNARGRVLRPYEFDMGNGRKVTEISDAQFQKFGAAQIGDKRSDYVRITRNGKVQFWQFADKSVTKSLQFAPLSSVPIFNSTRKIWQLMTTGLGAPWFAAKSFFWDVPLAKSTTMQGRSLGLLDTYARRLFNESAVVNYLGDKIFDPTAYVSVAAAIPYQVSLRAIRQVASKIEQDLVTNSGVFAQLAKLPMGKQMLERATRSMAATFDRSVFNVMQRHLSTSMAHLNDISNFREDYLRASKGAVSGTVKSMLNGYVAMIESVQNATRTAFFAENYSRLQAIHNGKIPKSELDKLVQETRNLTGDMSRTSNSAFIQKINSVIPYGNPILQGTRHILSAAIPPSVAKGVNIVGGNMLTERTNKFWTQFTSGILLPKLGALAVMSQWEGAEDFWYNKTPEWEQQAYIPVPNVEAINVYAETGKWPKFDPDYINKIPVTPEFGIFLAPIEAGLRSLGIIGTSSKYIPGGIGTELGKAFDQVTSFATPPLVQLVGAASGGRVDLRAGVANIFGMGNGKGFIQENPDIASGGANNDMMTFNSDYSRVLYDIVGSLAGATGQIAMQTMNVFDIAADNNDYFEAADRALDTFKYEVKRRFPAIDVPGLYNARERQYSATPESEYVFKAKSDLEPVFSQLQIEQTSKRKKEGIERINEGKQEGLTTPKQVSDPMLKGLMEVVNGAINKKGAFKALNSEYTDVRVKLSQLEASRDRWPEDAYHEKRNDLVQQQQLLRSKQAHVLTSLEKRLKVRFDRPFMQNYGKPFSYKALSEAVRSNVGD